jgi:flagellar hook-associated protein 1 FlgK
MSLDSALLSATSGLRHSARQLSLASQNIANAATEGYTRKTAPGEALGEGGVRTLDPRRDVDPALRAEARATRGEQAAAELAAGMLQPLAQLQGTPEDGRSIAGLLGALRDSLTALRASPGETGAQTQALHAAQDFATQMNSVGVAIGRARQTAHDTLRQDVDAANGLLREVARLDAVVRTERAAGRTGADALDKRDAAVARLSDYMDVTPAGGESGGLTLIMRGGAVLPLDPEGSPLGLADAMVRTDDYAGPPGGALPRLTLNGQALPDVQRGGRIGEAFALRDTTLPLMQGELDRLGSVLAARLDAQGVALFTRADGGPAPAPGSAGANGFAREMRVNPAIEAAPRLLRDGTHAAGGQAPNPANGPAGFTAVLDKLLTYAFGDEESPGVGHPAIGGSDLGPSGQLVSAFSPPRRILDYAGAVVASQAGQAAHAATRAADAKGLRGQLDSLVQAREGVDVDAEMAKMVQLQNAYAANARVMSAVQSMWDSLLAAVR